MAWSGAAPGARGQKVAAGTPAVKDIEHRGGNGGRRAGGESRGTVGAGASVATERGGDIRLAAGFGGSRKFPAVVMSGNSGTGGGAMRQRGFRRREHEHEPGQDQH